MNKTNKKMYDFLSKTYMPKKIEEVEILKQILLGEEIKKTIEEFDNIIYFLNISGLTEEEQGKIYFLILKANYEVISSIKTMFNTKHLMKKITPLGIESIIFKEDGNFSYVVQEKQDVGLTKAILPIYLNQYNEEVEQRKKVYLRLFNIFEEPSQEIYPLLQIINDLHLPKRINTALLNLYTYQIKNERTEIRVQKNTPKVILTPPKTSNITKKELKKALKMYYDENDIFKLFDYKNYNTLINILKELNYPEKQIEYIMANIARSHAENFYYYQYVYQKFCDLYPNSHLIKEVNEIICNMFIVNDEDYVFYKEYLLEILTKMAGDIQYSYSFDIKKVYKRQG